MEAGAIEVGREGKITIEISHDTVDRLQRLALEAASAENSGEEKFPEGHVEGLREIAGEIVISADLAAARSADI